MKKIVIILFLLLCGGLITGFEIKQIKEAQMDARVPLVVLSETLEVGTLLSDSNLEIISIDKALAVENTYHQMADILGKTLAIGLTKGTILSQNMITEQTFFTPAKGHSISAIKLNPEEILCWEVRHGEEVELVHVSLEGVFKRIGKVIVKGNYDQEMMQKNNFSTVPVYVLVEGESAIIETLIQLRHEGRIEVIKSR